VQTGYVRYGHIADFVGMDEFCGPSKRATSILSTRDRDATSFDKGRLEDGSFRQRAPLLG
jgi:hypothetical protein